MSIILYAAPYSSAIPVVHALGELDIPYELRAVDLSGGEQKSQELVSLNPNGKVPTLVADGVPMFEAEAIITWLGDRYGVARGLWPAQDDPQRMAALAWSAWAYISYGTELACYSRTTSERFPQAQHNAALATSCKAELGRLLGILDAQLCKGGFILGEAFSLVDLAVASVVNYGTLVGIVPAQLVPGGLPHVDKWLNAIRERPAFQRAWASAPREH